LIRKLIAKGKKVIVVTNCPYELGAVSEAVTVICNHSVTRESLKAAARMLYGKLESQGQWMLQYYAKPTEPNLESTYTIKDGITAEGDNEIGQVVY
jgi:hypothetical protein